MMSLYEAGESWVPMQSLPVLGLSHAIASGDHVSSAPAWWCALWILVVMAMVSLDVWLRVGIIRLLRSRGDDEDDDGGSRQRDPASPPPEPGDDFDWWPEFERQFAQYAARTGPARTAPLVEYAPDSDRRV